MTRAEKVQRAQRLREQGVKHREIAEQMGVSLSSVRHYLHDPDGSKMRARKDSYRGICQDCGAATDGSNGAAAAPNYCWECAPAHHAIWTCERIVEKIHEWAELYGRPPGVMDWSPNHARRHPSLSQELKQRKIERFGVGRWPSVEAVYRYFGSWTAGLAAAGFSPNPSGFQGRWEETAA
jgi:hypothetical protein